jgi:hypothetical protein
VEEIEQEFQPGIVHPAGRPQMFDAAELAQAFRVEKKCGFFTGGGSAGHRTDEALLLVMQDGLRVDTGELGNDFHGIAGLGGIAEDWEIGGAW